MKSLDEKAKEPIFHKKLGCFPGGLFPSALHLELTQRKPLGKGGGSVDQCDTVK